MADTESLSPRRRSFHLHAPQGSETGSETWPFDKTGNFSKRNSVRISKDIPSSPTNHAQSSGSPGERQHRRRSSRISSIISNSHGDPQLLAPTYSVNEDPEAAWIQAHGPPGKPSMEMIPPQNADKNGDDSEGEGVLAWLHSLIGFLIIFNAQ